MTQKVMIAAGAQCFEFDGEITEVEQDHMILKGKHGDIYIERKHVVFIQYLNDEGDKTPQPAAICCPWCFTRHIDVGEWETRPHHKHLCLTCKKLFRVEGENGEYFYGIPDEQHEPQKTPQVDAAAKFISKRLRHDPMEAMLEEKLVPPSQFPDDDYDDSAEIMRNVSTGQHMWNNTAITRAPDLQQAVKVAMKNEDHDFSMGAGGSTYKDPAQTILGMKNANSKKDRSR